MQNNFTVTSKFGMPTLMEINETERYLRGKLGGFNRQEWIFVQLVFANICTHSTVSFRYYTKTG